MSGREHKTVAVVPFRRAGIVFEELGPQHRCHIGHAHGHAGVTRVRGLYRVHGQRANSGGLGPVIGVEVFERCDVHERRPSSLQAIFGATDISASSERKPQTVRFGG